MKCKLCGEEVTDTTNGMYEHSRVHIVFTIAIDNLLRDFYDRE